jgi:prepilin peptidase CpaA
MVLILVLSAAVLAIAAVSDLAWRVIPNWVVLGLLMLAAVRMAVDHETGLVWWDVGAASLAFLALLLPWYVGMLGGGDLKLVVAACLLVGYRNVLGFAEVTSLCGAAIALVQLSLLSIGLAHRSLLERGSSLALSRNGHSRPRATLGGVPYGVAIAIGCITTIFVARVVRG